MQSPLHENSLKNSLKTAKFYNLHNIGAYIGVIIAQNQN